MFKRRIRRRFYLKGAEENRSLIHFTRQSFRLKSKIFHSLETPLKISFFVGKGKHARMLYKRNYLGTTKGIQSFCNRLKAFNYGIKGIVMSFWRVGIKPNNGIVLDLCLSVITLMVNRNRQVMKYQ